MAVFRLKQVSKDVWRVWARYQPFKGAATKSHIIMTTKTGVAEAAREAAEWVKTQRRPGKEK